MGHGETCFVPIVHCPWPSWQLYPWTTHVTHALTFSVPMFRRRQVHHQNERRCWKHMQLDLNLLDLILSTSTFADLAICLLLLITFGWFSLPLGEQTGVCKSFCVETNKHNCHAVMLHLCCALKRVVDSWSRFNSRCPRVLTNGLRDKCVCVCV